jgi:predicted phosphodiesterase
MAFGEGFGSDILRKQPFRVTTLDGSKPECRFAMVNDIHGNDSIFRLLMVNIIKSKDDLVIFNGDMLTQIESTRQIADGYMGSAGRLFSGNIPVFSVRGNHEYRGKASYDYMRYFPTSTGEPYYTFRQGPAFFIVLDGGEDKPDSDIRYYGLSLTDCLREEQAGWLKEVVTSDAFRSAPVKIAILHMPPGDDDDWHGMQEITRLFMPILNNAGIHLMLCGHLHRNIYIEKGKKNNQFPILINSNRTRVDADVDGNRIRLSVIDTSGKTLQSHQISK